MGKRINTLNTASSPANDDYLPIDGATNGTRKISADFINNLITDVEVDGTSVVTSGVAEINLSGKQDALTAGSNIQIDQDGTISATDTTYTAGTNVDITGGVISATDTTYTAGTNVTIDANNVISASDTTYSAGTNVQINNGVISATDTTYSAFGGATAGADGSSGLVPQPLIADKDKFLKGDGTWDTIQPGASALDDLTNVDITSPTNGQVLKYDSTSQEWVNANESGGGGGSTVTITPTLSTGTKIADYSIDGSTGALYAPNGGGGSSTLSGLSDVTITSPTDGQGLVYDATNQVWVNGDVSGGGGGNIDTLWSGSVAPTTSSPETVTLAHSIADYDLILVDVVSNDEYAYKSTNVIRKPAIGDNFISVPYADGHLYAYLEILTSTSIELKAYSSSWGASTTYTGIYGVKFGGGSGSGSGDSFITYSKSVTTTQYGWWVVEDENGNTLDPDTYVIIDISVNVRYYDVLWYQDSAGDYRATLFDINDGNTVRSSSTRTWTITYAKKDFAAGGGGSAAISGTTAPTSSQGSNGDIYMQYKAGDVSATIFSGTEHSSAYADPIEISVPNASTYDSFDITCLYYYWESQPIFDGVDSIDYEDLASGETIFMPSIDDPNYGVVIKLENNKFYIYPSTGYHLYVYEVVGHASGAPTKINHLYGKISNSWIESSNAEEISLPDYNALTTAQKNDGTIRFIPASNIGQSQAVDMSNITKATDFQNAMSATATSSTKTTITWNGGSNIGAMYYYTSAIDVTNWDKIVFDIKTGQCYDGTVSSAIYDRWYLQFGVMTTAPTTLASLGLITADDPLWLACKAFAIVNTTSLNQEIDVSNITGNVYIVVVADGWNATVENIKLATEGNVSQIKYMSKTYADGTGGGSGGGIDYSTTEHKVGTWIDGSDLYERTINITTGSFTATQDMDISNYIDSTEVVHESIGVFNYTYQGANYSTPINGRESEIVRWNGVYKLRLNFGSGSLDSMDAYVTIRYTKASS